MIKLENVTKYYGDKLALDNVSLEIKPREFAFIVGPTGAGKTTLVRLITKVYDPDKGRIYVEGKDVTRLSNRRIAELRRSIGMVFQDFRLLPNMTVYENVAFAMEVVHCTPRTIRRQVPQVLSIMKIEDKAKNFPNELSGGEQQRVAIARAIINNPKLLIADEPTGNLDPDTTQEIMHILEQINKRGTTVMMITHNEDIVQQMKKRVIVIDGGRLVNDTGTILPEKEEKESGDA